MLPNYSFYVPTYATDRPIYTLYTIFETCHQDINGTFYKMHTFRPSSSLWYIYKFYNHLSLWSLLILYYALATIIMRLIVMRCFSPDKKRRPLRTQLSYLSRVVLSFLRLCPIYISEIEGFSSSKENEFIKKRRKCWLRRFVSYTYTKSLVLYTHYR